MLTPLAPKAGPTGGAGLAAPPLICSLINAATSLAIYLKLCSQRGQQKGSFIQLVHSYG
jgi:hypothetical protein